MTSKDDQKSASSTALQQSLILEKIFTFLPTNFLLSTCSLVNKVWNAEARTFIRNNRKCTPWSPISSDGGPCRFLTEFAQLCEQIFAKGRVNPWNSLRINLRNSYPACNEGPTDDKSSFAEMRNIQLNYLDICFDSSWFECPVHRPISALLQSNGDSLLSLRIEGLPKLTPNSLTGWNPHFPRLTDVQVSHVYWTDLPGRREFIRTMLESAPNLKRIVTDCSEAVNVIPDEQYGLLTHLDFFIGGTEDDTRLLRKIAEKKPALEELNIHALKPSPDQHEDGERHAHEVLVVNEFRRRFFSVLEQLLNGCHGSVKKISVDGVCPLGQLSFPPLVHLSELRITSSFRPSIEGLWNSIATIDYSARMPQLRQVSIQVDTIQPDDEDYMAREGAYWDWPDVDPDLLPNSSSSVRKLSLNLQVGSINMPALQAVFPNVTVLEITMNGTEVVEADLPPVSEIWELWPDLEELHMSGEKNFLGRNFDADFCGINEEEAEFLRERQEEYLKAVHIVPIRPCPLTMSKLRRLWIDFTFDHESNFGRSFLSKMTELVTLKRMQGMDFYVGWNFDFSYLNEDGVRYGDLSVFSCHNTIH